MSAEPDVEQPEPYQPPLVEAIWTAEDLAREIHYAGIIGGSDPRG